jgi:uncharacterized protein
MNNEFFKYVKNRRSIYGISKETPISDDRIAEIVKEAVKHSPSPFNSQSSRVLLLLGEEHNKLWDITKETLRKLVPAESFSQTEDKINSFRNGYGTVLFFEDQSVVKGLQDNFPLYSDNFPVWSQHTSGMLQYVVWTALEAEGLGASLQHYGNLIYESVKKEWKVPDNWSLIAQMPFGKPTAPAGDKDFSPIDERVKIY